jgi:hypothetical protein
MLKIVAAGVTALLVTAAAPAYAQTPFARTPERERAADSTALTDARINIVKATLQLEPDQEQYWSSIEDAIRVREKDRQARIASAAARVGEAGDRSSIEALRDRNPVDFVHRRADSLAQRANDLKKLADAWQPLYQTLNPDQKRRMASLTILVLREMRTAAERRRVQFEDDDEEE